MDLVHYDDCIILYMSGKERAHYLLMRGAGGSHIYGMIEAPKAVISVRLILMKKFLKDMDVPHIANFLFK